MKKRIALGVIAALAAGLLGAVAPASATGNNTPLKVAIAVGSSTTSTAAETATAIAGPLNFVELEGESGDTLTIGGTLTLTGGTFVSTNTGTLNAAKTEITFDTTTVSGDTAIRISTPTAGTITAVYKAYSQTNGQVTLTTTQTFTITVVAALTSTLYNNTSLGSVETNSATVAETYVNSAGAVFATKGTVGQPARVAKMTATQYADAGKLTPTADGSSKAMVATITGVGLISDTNTGSNLSTYLSWAATTKGARTIYIYSDGREGVATISWTTDGVAVGSKTLTFWGSVAKYTVTNNNPHILAGDTGTVTVTAYDATGTAVPNAVVYAASGTAAAATLVADSATTTATGGSTTFTVNGVASGTSTLTIGNAASSATVTATATQVVSGAISTVTMAFDKATYAPGEKATITVTLKDANGVLVGDKGSGAAHAVFSAAPTSSQALQGSLPTAAIVTASGVKTFTVYMPVVAGPVLLTGTTAAGTTVSASASVVVPATAQETANAAAITALQTSVAALQTTMASLVASLTAQIRVINAALAKIAKAMKIKL